MVAEQLLIRQKNVCVFILQIQSIISWCSIEALLLRAQYIFIPMNWKIIIIIIRMTMFMVPSSWRGNCKSSPSSFEKCRLSTWWPPTLRVNQLTWPVSPVVGCCYPHSPSTFILITRPENWYWFYRLTEGGRLSRPRHCRKGAQPVTKAIYCSGCRDKHSRLWWDSYLGPLTPHSDMLALDHCDLQRHVAVTNLPKVVSLQHVWRLCGRCSLTIWLTTGVV